MFVSFVVSIAIAHVRYSLSLMAATRHRTLGLDRKEVF